VTVKQCVGNKSDTTLSISNFTLISIFRLCIFHRRRYFQQKLVISWRCFSVQDMRAVHLMSVMSFPSRDFAPSSFLSRKELKSVCKCSCTLGIQTQQGVTIAGASDILF